MTTTMTVNERYAHLHTFLSTIPSVFETEGREIYHKRNVIKTMTAPDGMEINVKRFHRPRSLNRLVYSWNLRAPKGQRAYSYADLLDSKGIDTPEPIALIEERGWLQLLGYSYLVTVQCDYGHTLYEVKDMPREEYAPLAKALAHFAWHIHSQDIMHKDFTPGNILWKRDEQGYHFSLVDINRMYFGKVDGRQGLCNLCRFWGPKAFTETLAEAYAQLRGLDVASSVDYVMSQRSRFWTRYRKKHDVPFELEL